MTNASPDPSQTAQEPADASYAPDPAQTPLYAAFYAEAARREQRVAERDQERRRQRAWRCPECGIRFGEEFTCGCSTCERARAAGWVLSLMNTNEEPAETSVRKRHASKSAEQGVDSHQTVFDASARPDTPLSRDAFIAAYCARSEVTWEWLSQYREALPCDCGEDGCEGWAMMPRGYVSYSSWVSRRP